MIKKIIGATVEVFLLVVVGMFIYFIVSFMKADGQIVKTQNKVETFATHCGAECLWELHSGEITYHVVTPYK